MVSPARRAALTVLQAVHAKGADLSGALEHARRTLDDSRDRALASEIVHGVLRWRAALDHGIAWAGRRETAAFDPVVLDILRVGAYQLLHLNRVPASAAVHDAVDQCRELGVPRAAPAVNAILRAISRRRGELPLPTRDTPLAYLSVTLSHPEWLAARWIARLGAERAEAWALFNNEAAPIVLRAHTWVESRDALAARLAGLGIETRPCAFAPDGLVVTAGNPLAGDAGRPFTVQDESSQLVAAFVGVQPGERILDTCASPGGKTTAMAGSCSAPGCVVAADLRPRRVRLLAATVASSGAPRVSVIRADAAAPLPFGRVFDAVLVDAPCSGLGTIRRDPDIRWRRAESDLAGLAATQRRMLDAAAGVVAPGGRLIYATCSSEPEENRCVVDDFLRERSGWTLEPASARAAGLPAGVMACVDGSGCLAPTPDGQGLESFFAACLRRDP
jgi:16S rRNA (cytosine967-C5)-methyltransferase